GAGERSVAGIRSTLGLHSRNRRDHGGGSAPPLANRARPSVSRAFPAPFRGGSQRGGGLRRMLQKIQHSDAVPSRQSDALIARDDLLGGRQRGAHDKGREIEPFVRRGGGKNALLLPG